MTENRVWYVNTNRKTFGPYTKDEVVQMLKNNTLKFNDYVFKEGYNDWDFLYNVADFDRRLIMADGGQPLVEAPKAEVPVEASAATPEGEDLWFVHDGEHQMGPYNANYIKEALNNKTIFWTYYVWRDGFENWVQIKECKEFDRRKVPRGQAPVNVGITTDFTEIKKQAVPTIDQNRDMYGNIDQPASSQYGLTEDDQEELKGKYPVKAIVLLVVISAVLFGAVRMYPRIIHNTKVKMRENKATAMYDDAQNLIKQNKFDQAYEMLFDLNDMYPDTKASRKSENELRGKEPAIKSQIADESRRIKGLMDAYTKKYGIMPSNAMDVNYVPPFYLKYFAETYYKRDTNGKLALMTKGIKLPVQQYVFFIDGNGKETERDDLKPEEFALEVQSYIKLSYTGKRSVVKPIDIPQIIKKDLGREEKKVVPVETKKEPETVTKIKETKRTTKRTKDELNQEESIPEDNVYDNAEEIKAPDRKIRTKKILNPDEQDGYIDEQQPADAEENGDQYSDEINKIRTDK